MGKERDADSIAALQLFVQSVVSRFLHEIIIYRSTTWSPLPFLALSGIRGGKWGMKEPIGRREHARGAGY